MQRGRLAGFTMIELMVTIVVAVVLISLAVPSFRDLIDKSRLRSATDDIVNLLNTSRASAVRLGLDVNASVTITSATSWCAGAISAVDPETVTVGDPSGTAAACDCTSTTACALSDLGTLAGQTSRVSSDSYSGVQLASNSTGNTILVGNGGLVFNSKFGALDLSALSGLDYLTVTSLTGQSFDENYGCSARADLRLHFEGIRIWLPIMLNQINYSNRRSVRGFSLIELMISVTIGLIVAAGAVKLIVAIDQANSETIQSTRLTQEVRGLANLIAADLKRVQRVSDPIAEVGQGTNANCLSAASQVTPAQPCYTFQRGSYRSHGDAMRHIWLHRDDRDGYYEFIGLQLQIRSPRRGSQWRRLGSFGPTCHRPEHSRHGAPIDGFRGGGCYMPDYRFNDVHAQFERGRRHQLVLQFSRRPQDVLLQLGDRIVSTQHHGRDGPCRERDRYMHYRKVAGR